MSQAVRDTMTRDMTMATTMPTGGTLLPSLLLVLFVAAGAVAVTWSLSRVGEGVGAALVTCAEDAVAGVSLD